MPSVQETFTSTSHLVPAAVSNSRTLPSSANRKSGSLLDMPKEIPPTEYAIRVAGAFVVVEADSLRKWELIFGLTTQSCGRRDLCMNLQRVRPNPQSCNGQARLLRDADLLRSLSAGCSLPAPAISSDRLALALVCFSFPIRAAHRRNRNRQVRRNSETAKRAKGPWNEVRESSCQHRFAFRQCGPLTESSPRETFRHRSMDNRRARARRRRARRRGDGPPGKENLRATQGRRLPIRRLQDTCCKAIAACSHRNVWREFLP